MSPGVQRPSRDDYFTALAFLVSERTTCLRRSVGAVLVKDGRVLSTGYNGSPKGMAHCEDIGCLRQKLNIPSGTRHELCRGVHAEQNAIIQAATAGVSTRGATLYCTHSPCVLCTKLMINSGIVEIVYCHPYRDELASSLIEASEILVREMPVPDLEEMVPDGGSI